MSEMLCGGAARNRARTPPLPPPRPTRALSCDPIFDACAHRVLPHVLHVLFHAPTPHPTRAHARNPPPPAVSHGAGVRARVPLFIWFWYVIVVLVCTNVKRRPHRRTRPSVSVGCGVCLFAGRATSSVLSAPTLQHIKTTFGLVWFGLCGYTDAPQHAPATGRPSDASDTLKGLSRGQEIFPNFRNNAVPSACADAHTGTAPAQVGATKAQ